MNHRMIREHLIALGNRVKNIRKALHMSQKDFAASLRMSGSYLSEIESGKAKPGHEFFFKMSSAFNISLDFLFRGSGGMFVTGEEPTSPALREFVEDIENVDDLLWFIDHSPLFKFNLMGFATKFHYENEDLIKRNIKKTGRIRNISTES